MTDRERLLAILDGRSPDRIPWIPRLLIWHTAHSRAATLPGRFEGMDLRSVERSLGTGTPARQGQVFRVVQEGDVETVAVQEGASILTTTRTPAGEVSTRFRTSEELEGAGIQALEVEHMIKGPDDYAAVEYLTTHRIYEATFEDYERYETEIGGDGYPLVPAGDCPFHHFLQKLAGYESGYYHLVDYPAKVERLLALMADVEQDQVWPILESAPAGLYLHGLHFDSRITPPPMFDRYITPYYRKLSSRLHAAGKHLCMHADNDSRLILGHIQEAGYDMVETFTTDPLVSCTMEEAREAWGTSMIIWGGVPSVILEPTFTEEAFEAYMRRLFRSIAPGDAFILGVADNVMPGALVHRLERITEMVETWGTCPVDPARIPN